MAETDRYRKYFEAAAVLGQITWGRAEELLREIMNGGDEQRANVQQFVDDFFERSRKATEGLIGIVRGEVATQMNELGLDPEDIARQAADILRRSAGVGIRVMGDQSRRRASSEPAEPSRGPSSHTAGLKKAVAKRAAKKATAPRSESGAAKKSSGEKSSAKKVSAKKSSAKKASAKKASVKKASTKEAVKKTAAKKAVASNKATAKKTSGKKAARGTTPVSPR
jgi:membrane protein involved in colicin uptake